MTDNENKDKPTREMIKNDAMVKYDKMCEVAREHVIHLFDNKSSENAQPYFAMVVMEADPIIGMGGNQMFAGTVTDPEDLCGFLHMYMSVLMSATQDNPESLKIEEANIDAETKH